MDYTNTTIEAIEQWNITTTAPPTAIKTYKVVRFYVMCSVLPLVCLIGVIGNLLSFIVWWKEGSKTSTNFLLLALSAVDSLFLINYFCYQSLGYLLQYNSIRDPTSTYVNNLFWITKFTAVYTIVIIAVDRCIAVCLPLQANVWATIRRTKIVFSAMVVASVLYNLPRFIKSDYTSYRNSTYVMVYMVGLYIVVYFIVPLLALMISNLILISNIKRADRRRAAISSASTHIVSQTHSNTQNITQILIAVITCFILCELPAFVYSILIIVYSGKKLSDEAEMPIKIFKIITEVLFACNSSINFFIYCLKGKKFRKLLRRVLKCNSHPLRPSDSLLGNTDSTYAATECRVYKKDSSYNSGFNSSRKSSLSTETKNRIQRTSISHKNCEITNLLVSDEKSTSL
ncbi:FMRFamide receptor-like [Tubulanus polymorphus]|uniref:FMRFamide receptor-like n=1 Tax=Tubulanus polymorphus TaxID=672921 RepID=UPI003DA20056